MTSHTVSTQRAPSERPYRIAMVLLTVVAIVSGALCAWSLWTIVTGTDAPESGAVLIPAACATIDPEAFPCPLPSMGVRW